MSNDTNPREVRFWECDRDREQLTCIDISEAVEAWADRIHPKPLPETVTVYGFAPMELPSAERIADDILDQLIERLDEDFGDQIDGERTDVTPKMREAALAFAEVFRREYHVWSCEEVTEVTVNVSDHVPAAWMHPERAPVPAVD